MSRKKFITISLLLVLVLALVGCNQTKTPNPPPVEPTVRTVVDRLGSEHSIPLEVKRVISYSPTFTQIILDLELGDLLIAVDTNSERFYEIPEGVASFDMMSPDNEALIALEPDLVIATDMTAAGGAEDPFALMRSAGISVITVKTPNTLAEIAQDVAFLSDILGKKEEGIALASNMDTALAEYAQLGQNLEEPVKVYFEISAAPYSYSFGKGVFLNEMIEILGCENIFGDQEGWLSVTAEAAVALNPDVIFTNIDYLEDPVAEILSREGWQDMQAIQNGEVYLINPNASSQANHHVIDALDEMAIALGLK